MNSSLGKVFHIPSKQSLKFSSVFALYNTHEHRHGLSGGPDLLSTVREGGYVLILLPLVITFSYSDY